MIEGKRIVGFCPAGRKRYMEILMKIAERERAAGHLDELILFNNTYSPQDEKYVRSLACDWVKVLECAEFPLGKRAATTISRFYRDSEMKRGDVVYVRLDDDLVHLEPDAIPLMVRHKIAHPDEFLTYPVIVNNTRMSYWLQEHGRISYPVKLTDVFLEPIAWRDPKFDIMLQSMALDAIYAGTPLKDVFGLPNMELKRRGPDGVNYSHVSVNCFAILGEDMRDCDVDWDEEGYLSDKRPVKQLRRWNGVCGQAIVVHFAYHPVTKELEHTSLLDEYRSLVNGTARPFRFTGSPLKA